MDPLQLLQNYFVLFNQDTELAHHVSLRKVRVEDSMGWPMANPRLPVALLYKNLGNCETVF